MNAEINANIESVSASIIIDVPDLDQKMNFKLEGMKISLSELKEELTGTVKAMKILLKTELKGDF